MNLARHGSKRVGPTSVLYVEFNDRLGLAVWCDFQSTGDGSSGGGVRGLPNAAEYSGRVQAADGRRVEWKWVTPDNASGPLALNGMDYDLARGRLFLVSTKGGKVEVRQLLRDLSGVRPDGLQNFADSDRDVTKFIAEGSKRRATIKFN
jgi:hypothetical protein